MRHSRHRMPQLLEKRPHAPAVHPEAAEVDHKAAPPPVSGSGTFRLPPLSDPPKQPSSASLAFIGGMALATLVFNAYLMVTHAQDVWVVMGLSMLVLLALRLYFETRIAAGAYENNLKGARVRSLMEFTIFGVVAPMLLLLYIVFAGTSVMMTFDPAGWIRFAGLTAALPIINIYLRHRVIHGAKSSRLLFYMNGFALGVGLFWSSVLLILTIFNPSLILSGQALFLLTPYAALVCNTYMLYKLSPCRTNAIDPPGKLPALVGALSSLLLLAGPELRAVAVGGAERIAICDNQTLSNAGMAALTVLGAQEDLQRQAVPEWDRRQLMIMPSLVGLPPDQAHTLYFRLTGKDASESSNLTGGLIPNFMPDSIRAAAPDLVADRDTARGGTAVGDMIPGLGVSHSTITGHVDTKTLTAALYWTLIFRNDSNSQQEARAQIGLPQGAVVSRATLWIDGKPEEAAFNTTLQTRQAYESLVRFRRDPLLISSTGKDRVLMQAFPVPPKGGEMKLRIGITAPISMISANDGRLSLPKLLQSNFKLEGKNDIHIEANQENILPESTQLQRVRLGQSTLIKGNVAHDDLKSVSMRAHWSQRPAQVVARASHTAGSAYIVGRLRPVLEPVSRLLVVVDSSDASKDNVDEIASSLSMIPNNVSTSVLYASDSIPAGTHAQSSVIPRIQLQDALDELKNRQFGYGQDNAPALAEAIKMAGNDASAAVLWIHGPQPVVTGNAQVLLSSVNAQSNLRIFDYEMRAGRNALLSLLKNKATIIPIANQLSVRADLSAFAASLSQAPSYEMHFEKTSNRPAGAIDVSPPVVSRMSTLWAHESAQRYIASENQAAAEKLAEVYRIVTPVTSAVVLPHNEDYESWNMHRNSSMVVASAMGNQQANDESHSRAARTDSDAFGSAPLAHQMTENGVALQGATNGTIGPQASDATFVTGVNTAGTVRINNLANLEAVLNVIASGFEVVGLCWGGTTLFTTIFGAFSAEDACRRILFGCSSILAGLVSPGCINWLVASSRDANLFS